MKSPSKNIFPVLNSIIGKDKKEQLLQQKAMTIWMTGMSGSGKTTIAIALEKKLNDKGFLTQILDGDNIRTGISNNLGFTETDRQENIRRISEVSKLFLNCGVITINCFISPTNAIREHAKAIIGSGNFFEVFIDTPLEVCEKRDVKGLYKKARAGEIKNFTGIDSPFEIPSNPSSIIKTAQLSIEESATQILTSILPLITYAK